MKPTRIAACSSSSRSPCSSRPPAAASDSRASPSDAVAVVDGTPVTKAELDALLARAKKTYKAQKRAFPKAGTAEYQSLQTQAVAFLVQRAEYDNRADGARSSTVTDKEIDDRIDAGQDSSRSAAARRSSTSS